MWGRRRLAYEINKKAEGIYAVIDLQATPEAVAELDRQLRLNESVLRTKVIRPEDAARAIADPGSAGPASRRTLSYGSDEPVRTRRSSARGVDHGSETPPSRSSATSPTTPSCASPPRVRPWPSSASRRRRGFWTGSPTSGRTASRCSCLQRLAPGRGERRRVAAAGRPGDRAGPAASAVVRDPRGREAHRHRAGGRRDRPVAAVRHGEGAEDAAAPAVVAASAPVVAAAATWRWRRRQLRRPVGQRRSGPGVVRRFGRSPSTKSPRSNGVTESSRSNAARLRHFASRRRR